MTHLSVGVLTADLGHLADDLEILRDSGAWAHVDVMDGAFCPAITVGPPIIKAIAALGIPVDVHLMVEEPRRFLPEIVGAGARVVTVHAEATRHLHRTLQELTSLSQDAVGFVRGVALNPGTPIEAVEPVLDLVDLVLVLAVNPGWSGQRPARNTAHRIGAVRALAERAGRQIIVGVDGGVTLDNAAEIAAYGPDVLVSGSAVYDGAQPAANLARLRRLVQHDHEQEHHTRLSPPEAGHDRQP